MEYLTTKKIIKIPGKVHNKCVLLPEVIHFMEVIGLKKMNIDVCTESMTL